MPGDCSAGHSLEFAQAFSPPRRNSPAVEKLPVPAGNHQVLVTAYWRLPCCWKTDSTRGKSRGSCHSILKVEAGKCLQPANLGLKETVVVQSWQLRSRSVKLKYKTSVLTWELFYAKPMTRLDKEAATYDRVSVWIFSEVTK